MTGPKALVPGTKRKSAFVANKWDPLSKPRPGPSAARLSGIPSTSRTMVLKEAIPSQRSSMGVGPESMMTSLPLSVRASLVPRLFSLPDSTHFPVNSVPICQPCLSGSQECNLTSLSISFLPWDLGLPALETPSPELGTEAL